MSHEQVPESLPGQGYWLRIHRNHPARARHYLCGETTCVGAECPNCRKPLLTLLTLDAHDDLLLLQDTGLSHLRILFCWTCPIAQGDFCYRLGSAGERIELLSYTQGPREVGFPYADYPSSFPALATFLVPLTDEEQAVLRIRNVGGDVGEAWERNPQVDRPQHQVGGEPYLLQNSEQRRCPRCGLPMPLFASVGDDTGSGQGFTQNAWVQTLVHLCRDCCVLTLYQRCD